MMSVSGVRGVVGAGLTPDRVVRLAAAFGTLAGDGKIVVGRDSRLSGDMIYAAVLAGLTASGRDVVRLDVVPTPTVQLAVEMLGAQGGIAVTASHNPPQWNALKFVSHHGTFLDRAAAEELFSIERESRIGWATFDALGSESVFSGALDAHVERILELRFLHRDRIAARRPKVVVDALHGAGGPVTARLLKALGCDAEILYEEPTGHFPREPEPLPGNIGELCEVVRAKGADVGFALDPDGDRLALVDETGTPIGEDATLPLAMDHVLAHKKGAVVTNYSTSMLVDAVAARHGCEVKRAAVGEANVVSKMKEVEAVIGGEGNGGVILPDVHLGRDAPVAMALIAALLTERDRPISAIMSGMPRYRMRKEKFDLGHRADLKGLEGVASAFPDARVDRTDGVYLRWADGFLHVRKSGTEPIVRVIAESDDEAKLDERMTRVRGLISAGR
jgi:phosphomannomutase